MNCCNCLARGNLHNLIALWIVSVPSCKASIRRGCATSRIVSTLPTLRAQAPKPAEYRSGRRDQNRPWHGLVLRPGGVVELIHYTGRAEFLQRVMQPQLFWGTNNRTPL